MGNFLLPGTVLGDIFFSFVSNFIYVAYVLLSLIFSTVFVFLLSIVYRKIRRKFPLKVNCWFCNNSATIPYDLYNAWDCPHCKQYNGFTKDGDYNKIIPEQYSHKLNEDIFKTLRSSVDCKRTSSKTNGFCKLCNINQQLKIQQLALFVPINKNHYYEEIEQYRERLEKAYKLCTKCEKVLLETLEKQGYNLLQNRLNNHMISTSLKKTRIGKNNILIFIKKNGILGLNVIQIVLGILLFLALIIHFETENQFLNLSLPDYCILEPLLPFLKVFLQCKTKIYIFKKEISFAGLVLCFLVQLRNKFTKNNIILLLWGLLHIMLWSPSTGLQVLISGFCVLLNIPVILHTFIDYSKKPHLIKLGCSPVKKVFPEVSDFQKKSNHTHKVPSPVLKNESYTSAEGNTDFFNNEIKETAEKLENNKKARQKENETESLPNEEKEKLGPSNLNSTSNLLFTKKSFLSSASASNANNAEINGPLNEVFNTLNNLKLGGKQKKANKPPNFLFTNHNYTEGKNSPSIIKPARLIKNLNSSSSWSESHEGNSRSSTPSSGYSSQKPEKIESSRYDFFKTVTPISVNSFGRPSPNNYFDYYDGTHGFYNMNSFSPGLAPFQFPGPLGHTTIYTYTRPTNFPFSFSPWHGYPAQKFSPTAPQIFDASNCNNLFQESSKKFGKHQRMCRIKSFFYHFSIFLNFVTIVSLMYFTSTGIILMDWKLPKFNFFV